MEQLDCQPDIGDAELARSNVRARDETLNAAPVYESVAWASKSRDANIRRPFVRGEKKIFPNRNIGLCGARSLRRGRE